MVSLRFDEPESPKGARSAPQSIVVNGGCSSDTAPTLVAEEVPSSAPWPDEETSPVGIGEGTMLTETIRLSRSIGCGGMGSVWLAEHLGLQTPVAVKLLKRSLTGHPGALTRFHREAAAAARVRSPHAVQVLDHGVTAGGIPYIVMEMLEGETLDAALERRGSLSLRETVEVVRQAAEVLAKAHDLGIVHRDIKPDNLFLMKADTEPFLKVLDFGIAKSPADVRSGGRVTVDGVAVGTPLYMSPEQMTGHLEVGPPSDVWSLGVVAYQCLTGTVPYAGASLAEIAIAIDRREIAPASALSDAVTDEVDIWLHRALEPSLDRRFRSVREMLAALEEALETGAARTHRKPGLDARSGPTTGLAPARALRRWAPLSAALSAAALLTMFLIANRRTRVETYPSHVDAPIPAAEELAAHADGAYPEVVPVAPTWSATRVPSSVPGARLEDTARPSEPARSRSARRRDLGF